ncbi:MAG: nickel pincer cofactor biosynthesis protein LarC, partial [Microcystaceae cyanobacterium]
ALPTGGGTVWAAHGRLAVPVPAVLKLWESRQVPVYSNQIEQELVTPTGAAILVTLAESFGQTPPMQLKTIGLGAGTKDLATANILRLWLGELSESPNNLENTEISLGKQEIITVLETQLDDLNPQIIGYLFEELFKLGALEVFTTAIAMKKSRPGILLTVLCHPEKMILCQNLIFRETTTLGIRGWEQNRTILDRKFQLVKTPYGSVSVKLAYDSQGNLLNLQPEFEDCAQWARQHNLPWQTIYQAAIAAQLKSLD